MITRQKKDNDELIFSQPTAEIFENNDPITVEEQKDEKYEALAQKLADLQKQYEEQQRTNMALLQTPQWKSQVNDTFVEVKPETVTLPDPALDPEGYDRATGERQRIRFENDRRRQDFDNRQRQSLQDKVDDLQEAFSSRYPDMAEDREKLDFAATAVSKQARKRGLDVERYMFVTQDKYIEDVAKKYVEVFGDPAENEDDDFDDAPRGRRAEASTKSRNSSRRRNREENDDVGRTGGIFGGTESGGRPSRSKDNDDESGPNMIDDIQALQRRTGFF